jgi:hypothetical protein
MEMVEARREGVLVIALKGRLDAESASSVQKLSEERIHKGERRVAVDAARLTYISSSSKLPVLGRCSGSTAHRRKLVRAARKITDRWGLHFWRGLVGLLISCHGDRAFTITSAGNSAARVKSRDGFPTPSIRTVLCIGLALRKRPPNLILPVAR